MAMSVAGFTFRSRPEDSENIVVSLNICLGRKVQITSVRLGFTGKRILQILFCLTIL
jgi:hypothetical protein